MIDPAGRTTVQEHPPPMLLRRLAARAVDSALWAVFSTLLVWPLAWGAVTDALAGAGFGSLLDFLRAGPTTAQAGSALHEALLKLQPIVVSALLVQLGIAWCAEVLLLTLTGSTPGKGLLRMRVVPHDATAPTIAPSLAAQHRSRSGRLARAALRTAIVVAPPALALTMLVAAWLGVPGATDLAEIMIALTLVLGVVWLAGGAGAHGLLSRTAVVPFSWRQVRAAGEEYLHGQASDPHRRRQAADLAGRARTAGEHYAGAARTAGERYAGAARTAGERYAGAARVEADQRLREHGGVDGLRQDADLGGLRETLTRRLASSDVGARVARALGGAAAPSGGRRQEGPGPAHDGRRPPTGQD